MEVCFSNSEGMLDVARLGRMWAELRTLPAPDADVMCHGDLTPPNVLVEHGRLAGVLDGGGFAPADPALERAVRESPLMQRHKVLMDAGYWYDAVAMAEEIRGRDNGLALAELLAREELRSPSTGPS